MFEILKRSLKALAENEAFGMIADLFEIMAMSQGGYSINLDKCCICGRKYMGEGSAVFKPEKGGIACLKCQHISAVTPCMSPDTVELFRCMQSRMFEIFDGSQAPNECIIEIRPVLKLHREYRLERHPKSISYLE
jgi:recombinational DNA repair protein (RecF pathway)